MSKTLVLIRHAHRDKPLGSSFDNGLSEKGKQQAKEFAEMFAKKFGKTKPSLVSSPKKRCIETLEPLSKEISIKVIIDNDLNESDDSMSKRMQTFLRWWKDKAPDFVVACSHGDWIPEFLLLTTEKMQELRKADWVLLKLEDGKVTLI